jgi:VWFA-related protein
MRAASQVLAVLLCGFSCAGFSQQSASPAEAPAARVRGVAGRRISIDVVVTDKSGKPISGLQQQDFTILDDKQPQPILSFHASDETTKAVDPPQQAIFVVDAVNAGFQTLGLQRQQLEKFLRQDGGQLPIPMSLVLLADTSAQVQPVPTRDGNALADSLDSNQPGLRTNNRAQGFYGAVDRVQISLHALEGLIAYEQTQPGRKLLVWLSSGWPLLGGPGVEMSTKNRDFVFNTIVSLSGALREARITVYSLDAMGVSDAGRPRTFFYESFLKGVTSANKVQDGNLGLQVLAVQSGGRVLTSTNDIANSIASCLVDAKAYYTLSFDSPPADHPDEYHGLQIKIGKTGLTARSRTGYYAQR